MPVSVNQSGYHKTAPGVDHLSVRRRRHKVTADFSDDAVTEEHVAVDEVTKARVDSNYVSTFNKDLCGHGG